MKKRTNSEQTIWVSMVTSALAAALLLTLISGCEDDDIRAYQAPKSEPYTEPQLMPGLSMPAAPAANTITWQVPEGWTESPNASSILTAVWEAGDARITVTKLSSAGGGVLPNINRWRGQVGLEPVQSIEAQQMVMVKVGDGVAGLIDLVSPEGMETTIDRIMVVMLPRPQDGLTWYFKMTGPIQAIDEHEPEFVRFVESIRFGETEAEHASHADHNHDATEPETRGGAGE